MDLVQKSNNNKKKKKYAFKVNIKNLSQGIYTDQHAMTIFYINFKKKEIYIYIYKYMYKIYILYYNN